MLYFLAVEIDLWRIVLPLAAGIITLAITKWSDNRGKKLDTDTSVQLALIPGQVDQWKRAQDSIDELNRELRKLATQCGRLEATVEAQAKEIAQLRKDFEEASKKAHDAKGKLQVAVSTIDLIKLEKSAMEKLLETKNEEIHDLKTEVNYLLVEQSKPSKYAICPPSSPGPNASD